MNSYTGSNIITLEGYDIIRKNPQMYITDLELEGVSTLIRELYDNAFDEARPQGEQGQVDMILFQDHNRKIIQFMVKDNGRGIPLDKLVESFTVLNTSGKFNQDVYNFSSGLYGLGAKVTAALSTKFRAISTRNKKSKSLYVFRTKIIKDDNIYDTGLEDGVIAIFEPDIQVFDTIDTYYQDVVKLVLENLIKTCHFSNCKVNLYLSDKPMSQAIFKRDIVELNNSLEIHKGSSKLVYESERFDKDLWISKYLGYHKSNSLKTHHFTNVDRITGILNIIYDVTLFYSQEEFKNNKFGIINGINIDESRSNHISKLEEELKLAISKHIDNKGLIEFFKNTYKLPVSYSINILYRGAKFTGTTKNAFYSKDFREKYGNQMKEHFKSDGQHCVKEIYDIIKEDINTKYLSYNSKTTTRKSGLFLHLNYPEKFTDANNPKNRENTELFIVEGDSAGGGIKAVRDSKTQAIYTLRGKVRNSISQDMSQSKIVLAKDPIYQDLMTILNIDHTKENHEFYFNKVLILCDPDADGRHISETLIGNLYALCPNLIEEGRVSIVIPPYYKLDYSLGQKKTKNKQYITDKNSYLKWLCDTLFRPSLNVKVNYDINGKNKIYSLENEDVYDGFVHIVHKIGTILETLSQELNVDPFILELLAYIIEYIDPDKFNVNIVKEILNPDSISYNKEDHILTLSVSSDDYIIPLHEIKLKIYENLLPMLRRINYRHLTLNVNYKNINKKYEQMTLYQFYQIMRTMENKTLNVGISKGLGSLSNSDLKKTSLDPRYREEYVVKNIKDIDVIWKYLGPDSRYRKRLLQKTS